MSSTRAKRTRKQVNYSEDAQAKKFDIGDRSSNKTSKSNTGNRTKRQRVPSTAVKELAGKQPYRGSAANKKAPQAEVLPNICPVPKKDKHGTLVFKDHPEFTPNLTPGEVMQMGSFGGTYFRPIMSAVTNTTYKDAHKEFPADWFKGLNIKKQVISKAYLPEENMYGVKCGGDLDMWEGSGWISPIDPYGWFQWYCRFYLGRRSTDDERQIARGRGVMSDKGRFRNQLIGRCARAGKTFDDISVSPVIRQALQHWGYTLTKRDFDKYVKLKGL
mmetsp:Transcript_50493/g.68664  ORF Transcript_50493/g.68664 Transcript_50493/m.68664 type:complete len:273 (-) Transcript_50493:293-1111(-)|eukprot:CAMPEP_0185771178 /NCGR_PEP_ID=MMETSP1174-20130828/63544_1 /TAXON_ID=35687 /ORGANISM="Dictyocha speculum, Strain CCMP1381" /LENGTH=272 /DNA_ID=CAMNT_0028456957 /DNA_START=320 /DNA_END=1138 /DNA_ORIENTATION=-